MPWPVDFEPMNDFKPGLEGVVAVETEIAEPDREGGSLRYRGDRHRGARRALPLRERSGACSSTTTSSSTMPDPEPYEPAGADRERARRPAGRDRAPRRRVEARQAERDLGRAGARGPRPALRADDGDRGALGRAWRTAASLRPDDVVAQGETAAEKFLLRWRGEADPRHVKAIDTYWICTAEHGLNASTFTARVVASTGADCGAALSSAVGALSGPLHGGAPAYVKPMLDEVDAARATPSSGCATRSSRASGSWASATASTAPRTRARGSSSGRRRSSARRRSRSPRSSSRPR